MSDELLPSNPEYWRQRWRDGRTGWDQGGIHPLFPELLAAAKQSGLAAGARILEPGCGRAHTSAALAQSGFRMTAFDVSELAITAARALYQNVPHLELTVADLFAPAAAWSGAFDAVYDRAVLCALPRAVRARYVATVSGVLKPGGLFLSLPFVRLHITDQDGPPFAVPEQEFSDLLAPEFEKIFHRSVEHQEPDSKIATEMIAVWRKKPR
jgi:SAM-dependent methyltransferase